MTRDPKKIRQHQELERIRALSHLFDRDPDHPERPSIAAMELPLPEGLTYRGGAAREFAKGLESEFPEVRRLSASGLAKMAWNPPDARLFMERLAMVAEGDDHQQVRQYAIKAMGRYLDAAKAYLDLLRDIARDETSPSYVRSAASEVVAAIQQHIRRKLSLSQHWCTRCKRGISEEEYMVGMEKWGKPYCRHCFDERAMESVNFESMVEVAKVRRTMGGTAVQSMGEKRIAEFLECERIEYIYDERFRIAGDALVRPDFYLPEFDLYIEYFGMDTPEYRENMEKKRKLYQRAGKKLVSVSWRDDENLEAILREKLSRYIRI